MNGRAGLIWTWSIKDLLQNETVTDQIWVGSCEPSNYIAPLLSVQGRLERLNQKYLETIFFNIILNSPTVWWRSRASRLLYTTITLPVYFYFEFLAPPGRLYSSPTTPEAVLFESKLRGTPLSIMRERTSGSWSERFPQHCWNCVERDNTK